MILETNQSHEIVLKEVYAGVTLITNDNEKLSICMRDTGFEFCYQGKKYSAQQGVLKPTGVVDPEFKQ